MTKTYFKTDLKWTQQSWNPFVSIKINPWDIKLPVDEETSSYQIYCSHRAFLSQNFWAVQFVLSIVHLCLPELEMVSHCEFCLRWETEASITLIGCEIYEITGHKAGSNRKTSLIIKDKRESFTPAEFKALDSKEKIITKQTTLVSRVFRCAAWWILQNIIYFI